LTSDEVAAEAFLMQFSNSNSDVDIGKIWRFSRRLWSLHCILVVLLKVQHHLVSCFTSSSLSHLL